MKISFGRPGLSWLGSLFFFSGFCALMYEITWVRKLSLIIGTDTIAISTIIAIYFAGMAIGSFLFARTKFPALLLYGYLEICIGIYAFFTPFLFGYLSNYLFVFIGLAVPTILMGGTLPVIVRAARQHGAGVGILYGANTVGATLGVLISGFYLIGKIGVHETIWVAALGNVLIGVLALHFGRRMRTEDQIPTKIISHLSRRVLLAGFVFGFSGIALEVLWTRVAVLVMGASTYAFSLVLIAFLLGIGIGSLLVGVFARHMRRFGLWTHVVALLVGIVIVATMPFLGSVPEWFLDIYQSTGQSFTRFQVAMFFLLFALMAIPTMGMGALFALLVGWSDSDEIGQIYAANTIGGVLGSFAVVFSIPMFGLSHSMIIVGGLYILVSLVLTRRIWLIGIGILSIVMSGVVWNKVPEPASLFAGIYADPDAFTPNQFEKQEVLFAKDSIGAHIEVTKDRDGILSLRINGKPDASTADDMENQILLGHIPLLMRPGAKDALVIGLGSGITLGSVLTHPVQAVDVVEIDEQVPHAAQFFSVENGNALDDPRVTLRIADGRHFLAETHTTYDVITSEPSNPWLSGSSKLFTKEFFELMSGRLKDDGVVVHWVNMYAIDVTGLSSIIRAYLDVFPHVLGFGIPSSNDFLLVGSRKPIVEMSEIANVTVPPAVSKDLARIGMKDPGEILGRLYLDRGALETLAGDTAANTDNHPIVEFSAPFYLYTPVRVNPWRVVMDHMSPLPTEYAKMDVLRTLRISARIAFVEGDYASFISYGTQLLSIDPTNSAIATNLARIYFESGTQYFLKNDYKNAIEELKRSLSFKQTAPAHVNIAQSYEDTGDLVNAKRHYERAIALDDSIELPFIRLADQKQGDGDLNSALAYYEKAIHINPDNAQTHLELGRLYLLREDKENARIHLLKAIKLDPKNTEASDLLTTL